MKDYFNLQQITELKKCTEQFRFNDLDKIRFIADNSLRAEDMRKLRICMFKNPDATIKEVQRSLSIDKKDNPFTLKQIEELYMPYSSFSKSLSKREFQFIFNPLFTAKMMEFLNRCFVYYGVQLKQIKDVFNEETIPKKYHAFVRILLNHVKKNEKYLLFKKSLLT